MEKNTDITFDGKPRIKTTGNCGKEVIRACIGVVEYVYEQDFDDNTIIKDSLLMLRDDMREVFYYFIVL